MNRCVCLSPTLSLALGGLTVLEEGTRAFHFLCLSLSLLGGLTMPEWKGRVPSPASFLCSRSTARTSRPGVSCCDKAQLDQINSNIGSGREPAEPVSRLPENFVQHVCGMTSHSQSETVPVPQEDI
ncbi:hypothetical protein EVAR_78598_1 [Eumeta japonica]|uniref:Uncharacterized protein n=1 Tax=Eumeta variegata TaxID=151549 RepID=A0A4C1U7Q7_EUMVA|nr:hypothetical protein EVAR_78598_1 [Eumeta japonica]